MSVFSPTGFARHELVAGDGGGIDAPTQVDPIVVEIEDVQGEPQIADWLGERIEVTWPINAAMEAKVEATLGKGFLVNVGTLSNPVYKPIEEALPDDRLVTIRTDRPNPESNILFFRGYLAGISRHAGRVKRCTLTLESALSELRLSPTMQIFGQLQLSVSQREQYAATGTRPRYAALYDGWPTVLNPDDKPNCWPNVLQFTEQAKPTHTQPGAADGPQNVGAPWEVSVFCSRWDPERQYWSWARWLLTLLYWARRSPDPAKGGVTQWGEHGFTDLNLRAKIIGEGLHLIDPTEVEGEDPDPWRRALLAKPVSAAFDGMNFQQALDLSCALCGIGYHEELSVDGEGAVRHGLRFFAPGDTGRKRLVLLPGPDYTTHEKTWEEVEQDADVSAVTLSSGVRELVNTLTVLADATRYEVTVELAPFWAEDPDWDVDPANQAAVQAALAKVGTDDWKKKYDRGGAQHAEYVNVGRSWAAPDYADFTQLARDWAPWTADRYKLLKLSGLGAGEALVNGQPGPQDSAAMPRPLETCVSGTNGQTGAPPVIELSLDSGATWMIAPAGVQVLRNRLGVYFEIESLTEVKNAETHLPAAFIEGKARVRVTGVIRGDREYGPDRLSTTLTLSERERGAVVNLRSSLKLRLRDDYTYGFPLLLQDFGGGNSRFKNNAVPGWSKPGFLDMRGLGAWVYRYFNRADRVKHRGEIQLARLRAWHKVASFDVNYRPGDEIEGVYAEVGKPEHDLPFDVRQGVRGAVVASVVHVYARGDGEGGGAAYHTSLNLEDAGALIRVGKEM